MRKIASYGVKFDLQHLLVSRTDVALALHNSDMEGMNAFFVEPSAPPKTPVG